MGLIEHLRGRKGARLVEPNLQAAEIEVAAGIAAGESLLQDGATATESVEAATERYFERLASLGIPSPTDWRNPKQKPATQADVARLYEVAPPFWGLSPWGATSPPEKGRWLGEGFCLGASFKSHPPGPQARRATASL